MFGLKILPRIHLWKTIAVVRCFHPKVVGEVLGLHVTSYPHRSRVSTNTKHRDTTWYMHPNSFTPYPTVYPPSKTEADTS